MAHLDPHIGVVCGVPLPFFLDITNLAAGTQFAQGARTALADIPLPSDVRHVSIPFLERDARRWLGVRAYRGTNVGEPSDRLDTIIELLRQVTSLEVVSDFLRSKGAHFSTPSWKTLKDQRILPAINDKRFTEDDLLILLRDAEEHGHQHVFLYHCAPQYVIDLLNRERVRSVLHHRGMLSVIDSPDLLNQPASPTIAEVRFEQSPLGGEALVIKLVETRIYKHQVRNETIGSRLYIEYELKPERCVNIARMHSDGTLELRIHEHAASDGSKTGIRYEQAIKAFRAQIDHIIPFGIFGEESLKKAKEALWANRESLTSGIRFSDSTMRNDSGVTVRAAARSQSTNLSDDEAATNSLDAFMSHKDSFYDSWNLWWQKSEHGPPSKEIHVRLSGMVHEFAITIHCSGQDYDYVFRDIKRHNK